MPSMVRSQDEIKGILLNLYLQMQIQTLGERFARQTGHTPTRQELE